jgi:hypothetical protein
MSGLICFKFDSDDAWVKAGWAFRQVLEDTLAASPHDGEMAETFAEAESIGWLYVDQLNPDLAERITNAMRRMIEELRAGKTQSRITTKAYGTKTTIEQYLDSLAELSELIPPPLRSEADPSPGS